MKTFHSAATGRIIGAKAIRDHMAGLNRRDFLISSGAALAAAGMPALAFAQGEAAAPKRGGTLNMLINPEPPVLVSIFQTTGPALIASSKVLEGLFAYDFDLQPRPQLATAWTVSPDGLKYTFTLRQNVKWHDGQPFTSADVAFSIDLLKAVHPRGRSTFANVTRVATPDAAHGGDRTLEAGTVSAEGVVCGRIADRSQAPVCLGRSAVQSAQQCADRHGAVPLQIVRDARRQYRLRT